MKINFTGTLKEFVDYSQKNNHTEWNVVVLSGNQLTLGVGGRKDDGYEELSVICETSSNEITDEFILDFLSDYEDETLTIDDVNELVERWVEEEGDYETKCMDVGGMEIGNNFITEENIYLEEWNNAITEEGDVIRKTENQWERGYGLLLTFTLPDEFGWDEVIDWNEIDYVVDEVSETSPAGMGLETLISASPAAISNLLQRVKKLMVIQEECLA